MIINSNKDWVQEQFVKEFSKPKLIPGDFYMEGHLMVLTEQYLKRRGYCCNNRCRHCPYKIKEK